ncbi:MAG: hypothetical protein J7J76_00470 [Candidatus Latescibacteria bacterium]|nr:hypothetical protein [Candidatus Latescibacterota bacterium]
MVHHYIRGTYYDLGFQIGSSHAELIRYIVRQYATYHAPLPKPGRCKQLDRAVTYLAEHFLWAVEELRGYGEGCGLGFDVLAFMLCFGFGRKKALSEGCSNVAFADSDRGPLLAGNLDDPPWHHLVSFVPEDGYAATFVHLPVMPCAWGGMNEKGLCVSGSSASLPSRYGGHPEPSEQQTWTTYLKNRVLLHWAATVDEALALFRKYNFPGDGNLILLDATGRGVVFEKTGNRELGLREMTDGWIACGNLFPSKVQDQDMEENNRYFAKALSRYQALERAGKGPHTLDAAKAVLASHRGDPDELETVCNSNTSCSMICLPAESKVLFTQRFPCQYPFVEYEVPHRSGS